MYRTDNQSSIAEFISPFGKLNPNNHWVKIAEMIPLRKLESKYAAMFSEDTGAPALPFRMAMGTLILKQMTGNSATLLHHHVKLAYTL